MRRLREYRTFTSIDRRNWASKSVEGVATSNPYVVMKRFIVSILMIVLYSVLAGTGFLVAFLGAFIVVHLVAAHQAVGQGHGLKPVWQCLIAVCVGGGMYTLIVCFVAWRMHKRRYRGCDKAVPERMER